MTTPSDDKLAPESSEQRTRWSRETLGVSPNATEEETARAIFTRLEAENFVPGEDCRAAALTLANPDATSQFLPNDADPFMQHLEQELCCEVDVFAKEFFKFPPAERQRRWEDISAKCGDFIVPKTRILALRQGLSVELAKCRLRDQYESELAGFICKAFTVLDPSKRFLLQIEFQRSKNWKPKKLRTAAKRLLTKYPKVAALAPDLIDDIRAVRAPQPKLATTTGDSKGTPTWAFLMGLVIVGFFIRAVVPNNPHPQSEEKHSANYKAYRENLRKNGKQSYVPAPKRSSYPQTESYPHSPTPPKTQPYQHPYRDDPRLWLPPAEAGKPATRPMKKRTRKTSSQKPPDIVTDLRISSEPRAPNGSPVFREKSPNRRFIPFVDSNKLPGLEPYPPKRRKNAGSDGSP